MAQEEEIDAGKGKAPQLRKAVWINKRWTGTLGTWLVDGADPAFSRGDFFGKRSSNESE